MHERQLQNRRAAPRPTSAMSPPDDQVSQSRRGSLALPTKAPAKQPRKLLARTHSTIESEAGSPAPSDTEGRGRSKGPRSGSGASRRQIIEQRLQESIDKGTMPQFCSHCGSIETPTWRKLYTKDCDGKPGPLDSVAGVGEVVAVKVTEQNEEGVPTKFQILKTMKKTKDMVVGKGFEDKMLCNPCGLWFNKYKGEMRPPEKWGRKHERRSAKERREDAAGEPPSDAFFSEQIMPEETTRAGASQSSAPAPPPHPQDAQPAPARRATGRQRASSLLPQPRRAASDDGNLRRAHRDPDYMRAIQSSPVRSQGSEASPIEVDLTPNPTRRLLFPSPRRDGEAKRLDDTRPKSASPPTTVKQISKEVSLAGGNDVNVFETFTYDKENMVPPFDDDLSHLFDGSPGAAFKTPARKTPAKRNITPLSQKQNRLDDLLKTPSQNSRKRKPLTPSANAANNADMNVNDFMASPSSTRYFLRSTPSRIERTPGGRTISNGGSNEASPFSRHLAQMLNDTDNVNMAAFTSPSREFDFSDLPTFNTPLRGGVDWKGLDDIMSSDFASYDDGSGMVFSTDMPSGQQQL